jgi:hypothetical protein
MIYTPYGVILWRVALMPLISGAFRVFRGKKQPSFTIAPFSEPYGLEPATL